MCQQVQLRVRAYFWRRCARYFACGMAALFLFLFSDHSSASEETPVLEAADWQLSEDSAADVKLIGRLTKEESGRTFVRFRMAAVADFQKIELISRQSPALCLEDFQASVKLNSTQKGLQLALRMVLPKHPDPRTRKPLTTYVIGDLYKSPETWQTLSVSGNKASVARQIRHLRAELQTPVINSEGAYFDGCVLLAELHKGATFIDLEEVQYGPIVSPPDIVPEAVTDNGPRASFKDVRVDRESLLVDDEPVFLIAIPDHGEPSQLLKTIGVNAVWVPNVHAADRMKEIEDAGMLVLATPPHPEFDPNDFGAPLQGLPPLEQNFPQPSIWYLGTRVAADQMPHLTAWSREVLSADRQRQRPLMVDVQTATGIASRQVDLVGVSQLNIGGRRSFGEVRNRSFAKQNATARLTLPWEWLQTEAPDDVRQWRIRSGFRPVHAEPEQIMMQLAASLSAGSRGIGFWKTQLLDSEDRNSQELSRSIELATTYLRVIEPLLVRGRVEGHIPIQAKAPSPIRSKPSLMSFAGSGLQSVEYDDAPDSPDAALITQAGTSLALLSHWDRSSHFSPQRLFAPQATMTVAATETASAWLVSATGLHGMRRQATAGGLKLHIRDFDQMAMVLITSDLNARRMLEERIHHNAERAAELFVELAALKLDRVLATCQEIDQLDGGDSSASTSFAEARTQAQAANEAFGRRDFPAAEKSARASMRTVRTIQQRYWTRAVQTLPSPTASPHTISFSTLPDHWAMMKQIDAQPASENLVPSGTFDSLRLQADGMWKRISPQDETYHATADIVSGSRSGDHVLRLRAYHRHGRQSKKNTQPTLLMRCPEILAKQGDLFEISCKVRMGRGVVAQTDSPFLFFDSDLGPDVGVSPALEPSWRTFRMYRKASSNGPLKVWMSLQGAAEVYVDDFTVIRHRSAANPMVGQPPQSKGSRVQGAGYSNPSFP